MTKQEVLNAANVMIAYANGKKVGTRPTRSMEPLLEILYVPTWNWEQKEYFVIPDDCSKELENDDQAKAHKLTEEEQRIFIASECERMANVTSPNLIELGQIQKEQSNVSQGDDYFYEKEQLNERIKRMEEALESIREYWNRDNNNRAMIDACWYAIDTASEALEAKEAKP